MAFKRRKTKGTPLGRPRVQSDEMYFLKAIILEADEIPWALKGRVRIHWSNYDDNDDYEIDLPEGTLTCLRSWALRKLVNRYDAQRFNRELERFKIRRIKTNRGEMYLAREAQAALELQTQEEAKVSTDPYADLVRLGVRPEKPW